MNLLQFMGSLEIGLIYALVAIGVYISFRVIDFPDLTVDGSFTLGDSAAIMLIAQGQHPLLATGVAILAGMAAGVFTGILHVRWRILGLLAGILTMTALYSLNLRIMGKPNIAIIDEPTLYAHGSVTLITLAILTGLIIFLAWLFATHFGLGIRAIGINPKVSRSYGISVGKMQIIALGLGNGTVALGGALFAQSQGFSDISMGTGTIVIGLASVIIGETLFRSKKIWVGLLTCVVGSVLYRIVIALALNTHDWGLQASDLNIITAVLIIFTMILPQLKIPFRQKS